MQPKQILLFLGVVVTLVLAALVWHPLVGNGQPVDLERNLTVQELGKVTGLVGIRNDGSLCGDVENRNEALSVTKLEVRVLTFADGDSAARGYVYAPADSAIAPREMRRFCLPFELNEDENFTWEFVAARGLAR